jgi:nicotinate-nucleotide pyrophosphorylase (carboxylating)
MEMSDVQELIRIALAEDVGAGDVTAEHFIPVDACGSGELVARESLVVAGVDVAAAVFAAVDSGLEVERVLADGKSARENDVILRVAGSIRSIVTAERTALNFLQRLSGVATATRACVDEVSGLSVKILDTRKTTPGWRKLEKAAVVAGGGTNHRMGLYDQVMVKDNHLLAESNSLALQKAIDEVAKAHPGIVVELEADRLDQLAVFLELKGVDVVLLDNMSCEEMQRAVEMAGGRVSLEASGGVTLERLREIAGTGVDAISTGAITHSARAVDISLELRGAP